MLPNFKYGIIYWWVETALVDILVAQGKANEHQLQLALTWNRSDVAEDKIFNQDIDCSQGTGYHFAIPRH